MSTVKGKHKKKKMSTPLKMEELNSNEEGHSETEGIIPEHEQDTDSKVETMEIVCG